MNSSITPAMAQRIELWPTDRLVPYAKNARTHSPEQVAPIAASIVEFGFVNPILVDTNAGIIAGHGRLLAARKLGLAVVPVVVLDHLSETQRRAYIIADNKLAQNAGWDDETLAAELGDLEAEGVDLTLVGFSDDELEELLAKDDEAQAVAESSEEPVPEPPLNPVTGLMVKHFDPATRTIRIEQRNWRMDIDEPKTEGSKRILALGDLCDRYLDWIANLDRRGPNDWIAWSSSGRTPCGGQFKTSSSIITANAITKVWRTGSSA